MLPNPAICISQPPFFHCYYQYFISGDVAIGEGVMRSFMTTVISKLQFGFSLDLGKSFTILRVNMMLVLNVFQWLIVVTLYPALLVLYRRNGLNTAIGG